MFGRGVANVTETHTRKHTRYRVVAKFCWKNFPIHENSTPDNSDLIRPKDKFSAAYENVRRENSDFVHD